METQKKTDPFIEMTNFSQELIEQLTEERMENVQLRAKIEAIAPRWLTIAVVVVCTLSVISNLITHFI